MYVAELCEPSVRGLLSSLPEIFVSSGILMAYLLAGYLPWRQASIIFTVPPIIGLFSSIIVPEVKHLRKIVFLNFKINIRYKYIC